MALVITRACEGVCDTACVDVCPCNCIEGPLSLPELARHKAERPERLKGVQLFIDPERCIDCFACQPVCPEQAIFHESELPDGSDEAARNAAFFTAPAGPPPR